MSSQSRVSQKSHEEIEKYWTPERREKAIERPFEPTDLPPSTLPPPGGEEAQDFPGHDPHRERDRTTAGGVKTEGLVAARLVPDPDVYPWRAIGKLFFTADGVDYVGSACVISRDGLLTAAHNLYDVRTKTWSDDLWFYPAYNGGSSVYGSWRWDKMWVPDEWSKLDQEAYDVGLLRMRTSGGRSVGDVVGWLGYSVDRTVERSWIDVGYPSDEYEGKRMMEEEGAYTRMLDSNKVVGKQGNMSGGASGGPWLLYGNKALVNGLHSFRRAKKYPGEVFSPYFATWVVEFIRSHLG
ncbi:MAG TPA: hypothetical protein VN493_05055 [Thermoanaerobaculia bacterium]|nr:hypothetical protein [Thermoanaerobaculia bacterium]